MSQDREARMRENFLQQGGRSRRRTMPAEVEPQPLDGPGRRADERILSVGVDELLPDRYQGRLRWPVDLAAVERLYDGSWDAQDFLAHVDAERSRQPSPALDEAWSATRDLARSILTEGQIAPITISPGRDLPLGYRYVIETGEGRYWAYQMMRWLLEREPTWLGEPADGWQEDPSYVRAVVVSAPSRLRQVAENEQRQSYRSAVDRAVAYASMLAEAARYEVEGSPPGIRDGRLELPEAYWRAARRGLRGRQALLEQLPVGARQVQRHLSLLLNLDPATLATAKENGLSEAQLRPVVGRSADEQRHLVRLIVRGGLSSRQSEAASQLLEEDAGLSEGEILSELQPAAPSPRRAPRALTLPEESSRLLRSLTTAARRYEALRDRAGDQELLILLEAELAAYDESARGAQRLRTPRRRLARLRDLLASLEP